jgi:hypothetical protein
VINSKQQFGIEESSLSRRLTVSLLLLMKCMRPRSHFERRINQRIPTSSELWVSCRFDDRRSQLRVQDFSISGALLLTEEAIPVGTRLDLLFSVPEGEIRVLAVVRSFTPSRGIGVEFVSMESSAFDLVLKLVKRLLSCWSKT